MVYSKPASQTQQIEPHVTTTWKRSCGRGEPALDPLDPMWGNAAFPLYLVGGSRKTSMKRQWTRHESEMHKDTTEPVNHSPAAGNRCHGNMHLL